MPLPPDDDEEVIEEEPEPATTVNVDLHRLLGIATSITGLTAIAILTFEMVLGTIRFGTLIAYLIGTAFMVGLLILMIIGFQWGTAKISPGLGRYAFWLLASPLGFIYYLGVAWLVYVKMAQFLIGLMGKVLINAPGGAIPG